MTYFSVQPRKFIQSPNNHSLLGPGQYQIKQNTSIYRYEREAYAPFGSLQKKTSKYTANSKDNKLGPGDYEVSGKICKPSITKYENNNCIIIKINDEGSSQFKSRIDRFKTSPSNYLTPGPGEYELNEKDYNKSKKKLFSSTFSNEKTKNKTSKIGEKIKQLNLKNYIQRRKPTLTAQDLQQKKPFNQQNYNNSRKNKNNRSQNQESLQNNPHNLSNFKAKNAGKLRAKGVSWSLNTKQRFQPLIKEEFTEKHKEQIIQKIRTDKKAKLKQKNLGHSASAVFASKSLKSDLQKDIYQTSNPFKVELRKMIDYKDERPGPGSYQIKGNIKQKYCKPARHQFFGSTVDRFQSLNEQDLGPGYYQPKIISYEEKKNYKKLVQHSATSEEGQNNRSSYIQYDPSIPGPGAYNANPLSTKSASNKTSCKWVFGSKINRFQNQDAKNKDKNRNKQEQIQNIQEQERQNRKQQQYQYRRQLFQSNKKSSTFVSKTKRLFQSEIEYKSQDQIPTIGQYNVGQNDIASRLKKIVQKSKEMSVYHSNKIHPFMSSIQRFKSQQNLSHSQNKGHKDCWCLVKSVQKQVFQHESPAFLSKQKRIIVFDNKNKDVPAIGTYTKNQQPQASSFIKNSFNSKFIKAGYSKTKKISIWTKSQKVQEPILKIQ